MLEMQLSEINISDIENEVKRHLGIHKQRYIHSLGVAKQASLLAKKYGISEEKAYIAGLVHDYRKYDKVELYESELTSNELLECKKNPVLFHSYLGAYALRNVFGIFDSSIFTAVKYHVFGDLNMSLFSKIIMISDYTEENRTYPDCIKCREILDKDGIDKAIEYSLRKTIENLSDRGINPGEKIYKIHNEYERKINGRTRLN